MCDEHGTAINPANDGNGGCGAIGACRSGHVVGGVDGVLEGTCGCRVDGDGERVGEAVVKRWRWLWALSVAAIPCFTVVAAVSGLPHPVVVGGRYGCSGCEESGCRDGRWQ